MQRLHPEFFPRVAKFSYPVSRFSNKRTPDPFVARYISPQDFPNWGLAPLTNNYEAVFKNVAKYEFTQPSFTKHHDSFFCASRLLRSKFVGAFGLNNRVLSFAEAVDRLDLSTSAGSPWNLEGCPLKSDAFSHPGFATFMRKDWEQLLTGEYTTLFSVALKEEIRPEEKNRLNKVRTFVPGSVEFLIHCTRLFATMSDRYMEANLAVNSTVGFNVWGGGWDRLFTILETFKQAQSADFSSFDGRQAAAITSLCGSIYAECLPSEYTPAVEAVFSACTYSFLVLPFRDVVQTQNGNKSGSFMTIVVNNMVNTFAFYYTLARLFGNNITHEWIEKNFKYFVNGDDNIISFSDVVAEKFTMKARMELVSELGMEITFDHDSNVDPTQLMYLGANTRLVGTKYVPVYQTEKLKASLYYTKRPGNVEWGLYRATGILLCGFYDPEFKALVRKLIGTYLEHDIFRATYAPLATKILSVVLNDEILERIILGDGIKINKPNKTSLSYWQNVLQTESPVIQAGAEAICPEGFLQVQQHKVGQPKGKHPPPGEHKSRSSQTPRWSTPKGGTRSQNKL